MRYASLMEILTQIEKLSASARGGVVAIGNFDGVHRGHQVLVQHAKDRAAALKTPLVVLTFEPHPRTLFQPDAPSFRITPSDLKAQRLEKIGVDILCPLPFNWDFAALNAESFIQNILIQGLGAAHVVVGYDFKFGQFRKGTPAEIEAAGLPVTVVEEVEDEGAEDQGGEISSSRIRQFLRQGQMEKANVLLGWNWEIRGTVVKGDQRGRALGYPTANFPLGDIVHPAYGVYAARVQIEGEDQWRSAAINIGIRPMFETKTAQVESYIFDFNREIYGKILRVQPVEYLRSEAKFNSLDELKAQMQKDCEAARRILQT